MTSLSSSLPKDDANGLAAMNQALIAHPDGAFIMLAVIDCKKITTDIDTGEQVATARIRRIEAVPEQDKARAAQLLVRAQEERLGKAVLPIDLEDDLRTLLAHLNPETGELLDDSGTDDD